MKTKARNLATSDLHFGHSGIVEYCNRPTTPEKHNQWIVDTLNSQINPQDTVYHHGDLAFRCKNHDELIALLLTLNGTWRLIPGNHDDPKFLKKLCEHDKFELLPPIFELKINKQTIVMCHYPIENWNKQRYGSIHTHGHLHDNECRINIENRYNVCLDYDNFKVVDLNELVNKHK